MTTPDDTLDPENPDHSNLHDDIIALLLKESMTLNDAQAFFLPLQAVATVTPEILSLALRHMTTGSELARSAAARSLGSMLLGINHLKTQTTKPWHTHVDVYRESLDYYEGLSMEGRMTLGWHFNNVASEMRMNMIEVDAIIHHTVANCAEGVPAEENPDVYWRGVSALHIACRDTTSKPDVGYHVNFIREAGSSDDMAALVALAQERNNLSIAELRSILENQRTIYPGLQSGTI